MAPYHLSLLSFFPLFFLLSLVCSPTSSRKSSSSPGACNISSGKCKHCVYLCVGFEEVETICFVVCVGCVCVCFFFVACFYFVPCVFVSLEFLEVVWLWWSLVRFSFWVEGRRLASFGFYGGVLVRLWVETGCCTRDEVKFRAIWPRD